MRAFILSKANFTLLFTCLIGIGCAANVNPPLTRPDIKLFSLQRPNRVPKQPPPELRDPEVYGLSWRFRWKTIEPQNDHYRWELLDQVFEMTWRADKYVMLRIVPGIHTPDWVYAAGAKAFTFRNADLASSNHFPTSAKMPLPWDDVYLAQWTDFIRDFGNRYNGQPGIYSIPMAGGGHIGEMNLPKAHAKWKQAGYTDTLLIEAWKHIIDTYQRAFPDTPTNLAINEPLGRRNKIFPSHVMQPVVDYVLRQYPGKVYLQQNGLRAHFPYHARIRKLLREATATTAVGYQMVGGKGFKDERTGNRAVALQHALEDGASYLEIYAGDIRDVPTRKMLHLAPIGKPQ